MTDIYGARFINVFGEKDSGVWQIALNDLDEDSIRQGLYLMMRDKRFETWPPTCLEFRHLCLSGKVEKSLPTVHQAFNEARQNALCSNPVWSHQAIKCAVKYVGVETVNSPYTAEAFQKFKKGYEKICARIHEGYEIPAIADEEVAYYHRKQKKHTDTKTKITILMGAIHASGNQNAVI